MHISYLKDPKQLYSLRKLRLDGSIYESDACKSHKPPLKGGACQGHRIASQTTNRIVAIAFDDGTTWIVADSYRDAVSRLKPGDVVHVWENEEWVHKYRSAITDPDGLVLAAKNPSNVADCRYVIWQLKDLPSLDGSANRTGAPVAKANLVCDTGNA